ncbi:MAG TPA: trypsin-like peptidase domain-containing protein [Burkholderiales bacterium]|nr:trypsin-like peptidase domain-containing protein [Burkholderiales bacterium]
MPAASAGAGAQPAVAADAPIVIAEGTKTKTLRFSRLRTALREGERLGEIKFGLFCNGTANLSLNSRIQDGILGPVMAPVRDEFARAGYPDPVGQRGLFEEDADQTQVDLQLGALLEEFNTQYCPGGGGARIDGRVRVKVRWQLYDPVSRKIVYTAETSGSYQTQGAETMRESEFFGRAYRQTVRQLLADPKFREAVIEGGSAAGGSVAEIATAEAAAGGSPSAALALKRAPSFNGSLADNMTNVRAAVVTVTRAGASGSGFFVGEGGYVLTNSHVVAGSRFVRVKLITGRELVGEVVKQDSGRDVALIKTEGRDFMALPIATVESNIGSEVTAIGSPLGEALSGTVTRGIVSAYRTINTHRYVQSDVSILPGNSGGPLLDRGGRVVGIAVSGLAKGVAKVNFFVPIQEALDILGLRIID